LVFRVKGGGVRGTFRDPKGENLSGAKRVTQCCRGG